MSAPDTTRPDDFLPLRPVEFQILLSLSAGERHGYGILHDAEERGEGSAVPGLATLYRALRRLEARRLIETTEPGDDGATDEEIERRRYFRLTGLGREVAAAEAGRLDRMLRVARRTELLGHEGEA